MKMVISIALVTGSAVLLVFMPTSVLTKQQKQPLHMLRSLTVPSAGFDKCSVLLHQG